MEEFILQDRIVFGGLLDYNQNSIKLRQNQINDNFRIHSCYYYNQSLDVIKKASEETNIIPKLTTKVYFNYKYQNNKAISIFDQLDRIVNKLNFIPKDWHIQLCVNPSIKEFKTSNFKKFQEQVKKNYGNIKFFIETEVFWEKNTVEIIKSNSVDGSCFFMNNFFRSINNEIFINKPFITYGMLAGGNKHKLKYNIYYKKDFILDYNSVIDQNLIFLMKLIRNKNFKYSVTSVSSKENYFNIIERVKKTNEIYKHIDNQLNLFELIDYCENKKSDTYGIKYKKSYEKFIYNKKRVLYEIFSSTPFLNFSKKWI